LFHPEAREPSFCTQYQWSLARDCPFEKDITPRHLQVAAPIGQGQVSREVDNHEASASNMWNSWATGTPGCRGPKKITDVIYNRGLKLIQTNCLISVILKTAILIFESDAYTL
jgi:hypothetical protein